MQGLGQGDPLSLLLYNIVLEQMLALRRQLTGLVLPSFNLRTLVMLAAVRDQVDIEMLEYGFYLYAHTLAKVVVTSQRSCQTSMTVHIVFKLSLSLSLDIILDLFRDENILFITPIHYVNCRYSLSLCMDDPSLI
jgi:hypothetical protein